MVPMKPFRPWAAAPLAALLLAAVSWAEPVTYVIDPVHSQVGFSVKHLFTKVPGRFTRFSGTIVHDLQNPAASRVEAGIETASINTDVERRDNDLRSSNFFAADSFPKISFVSRSVAAGEGNDLLVKGDLTMRGVTKPVTLQVRYLGGGPGMRGNQVAGFEATTRVNRKDFGISWNRALDNGGWLLGDDVDIVLSIEAGTPPPAKP
jgi:polyisoprenoid-binding protein YceI